MSEMPSDNDELNIQKRNYHLIGYIRKFLIIVLLFIF